MQVIIFPQDDNRVSIITPAAEFADQIEAVAAKDVPDRRVFVQTGTEPLTQDAHDEDPEYWAREGFAVGDLVPTGHFENQPRLWRIINADDLPDRATRNLWRWTASGPLAVDDLPTG